MRSANVKAVVAKVMAAGMLAGAFVMAAPQAQAQDWRVGVAIGGYPAPPVYGYGPDYYARLRWEEHERAEAYARHEAFERHEREEARERYYYRHDRDDRFRDRDDRHWDRDGR